MGSVSLAERIQQYHCFPETLAEGRAWFEALVPENGGEIASATLASYQGPDGENLSTEVAWFGRRNAPNVYLAISGTHGQEYFCGAAGQLGWITSGGPRALDDETAVCLVHAHNPYGAAWLSRGNEDFVDLNRNYMDFDEPVRPNRLYAELYDLLFTREMSEHVLDDVMASFYQFLQDNDDFEVMTAMGGGQDTHPRGTIYCGTEQAWSTKNLKAIVDEYFGAAEKVAVIDWHTGLGEPAVATALEKQEPGSPAEAWAKEYWNADEGEEGLEGPEIPDYVGQVWDGTAADIARRGADVISTVVEIGTVGNQSVLAALLLDRWLRFECDDPMSPFAVQCRTKMIERLNPSRPEWRMASLAAMHEVYDRTIAGLKEL